MRRCWRAGDRRLALRLLFGTAPMVFAAVVKRSLRVFRKAARPVVLAEQALAGGTERSKDQFIHV
jgi:hypothetical protein